MTPKDICLALLIILAWGFNFVVIKFGVEDIPPLLLACLRFIAVAFPAIFFIKRPKVPFKLIFLYASSLFFAQFALLFISIHLGMPAGLASLLLQAQAFFTLILGALLLSDKIQPHHWLGILIAAAGIFILADAKTANTQISVALLPLLLVLAAAFAWAIGNISNKIILKNHRVDTLSLVVWGSLIPILPFFICSWLFEGKVAILQSLQHFQLRDFFVIGYLAYIATIIGTSLWGYLLNKYETWRIAPLTLLVPVVGIVTATIVLNEHLSLQQGLGAAVIILGLCVNVFGRKFFNFIKQQLA
ncbi:EamA family transporter [Acinetobacter sp. MD2(2019)]|uniref:EamA family transporter n=1 Tax=Acinetobacter sp. MD2(2019) TaxID=2605273 RepID=UPI002D1F8C38|nr:EamA family transporter [Acinetobacter sp. MD2(2019)]MEB3754576.1 EamA family transporter [Acinetobacter sp. MD2(2019)]